MPYDSSVDKSIFSKTCDTDTGRLTVSIYSYNNGPKKLQLSRETRDEQDNFKFSKLGRMTKREIEMILPIIQEAVKNLD